MQDRGECICVLLGECIGLIAVDIENGDHRAVWSEDRQHQFGPGATGTGNMICERFDIRDKLYFPGARGGPADPSRKRDGQAAMSALIWPDFQQLRFGDAVESNPIEPVVGMKNFAGDRRHQRDRVGFAFGQGSDGFRQSIEIHTHFS